MPSKRSDSDDFLPHTRRVNRGRGGTSSGNNLSQLARNSTRHIPLIRSQSTSRRYSTSSVAPPVLQPPSQTREWVVPSLLRTNRGNPLVVHQNCRFRFHRPTADGSHGAWRCNEKTDTGGCPARIICHGNTPLDNQSPNHNHAYPTNEELLAHHSRDLIRVNILQQSSVEWFYFSCRNVLEFQLMERGELCNKKPQVYHPMHYFILQHDKLNSE